MSSANPAHPMPSTGGTASPAWWRGFLAPVAVAIISAIIAAVALRIGAGDLSPIPPADSPSGWSADDQAVHRVATVEWLAESLQSADGRITIVDLSSPARYAEEHIPGAVHGWWQDGMDPHARAYGERYVVDTDPDGRAAWFAALGIEPGTTVVAYDDRGNVHASRLVWLLVDSGHADAMILDGGLAAWKGAGWAVESDASEIPNVPAEIAGHDNLAVVTTPELEAILASPQPDTVVVDVRTESERADTLKGVLPIGAIPGSVWLPRDGLYREDRLLRSPEELRQMIADAGLDPDDTIVVYGRFGIDTGLPWLIMTTIGYDDVRIYDQGWVTWAEGDSRPIEPLQGTVREQAVRKTATVERSHRSPLTMRSLHVRHTVPGHIDGR